MLNRVIRKPGLYDIQPHGKRHVRVGGYSNLPDITLNESLTPSACFLGPKAENMATMRELVELALNRIEGYRRDDFGKSDPPIVFDPDHPESLAKMADRFGDFCKLLDFETPFASLRYQGHMLSDNLLPALAGYFVTMLHNPNNVTIQASTASTLLEMLVMRDLCDMFGFEPHELPYADLPLGYTVAPWAHTTADGSLANIEGLWSAREAKFLPFAIKLAVAKKQLDAQTLGIHVTPCYGGSAVALGACDNQVLLNLKRDERLALPARIAALLHKDVHDVWSCLAQNDVNALGWAAFEPFFGAKWPVVLVPSTAHYSWPKATAVLGLGTGACQHVDVDAKGRMDRDALNAKLGDRTQPILAVVSVFGSTEESAVDPLDQILELRTQTWANGLHFDVHVDAAWGGYLVSCIRKEYQMAAKVKGGPFLDDVSGVPLNDHVVTQAMHIRKADSVTVDPHKMGYVQYPAGFVMYGNQDVTNLTTFTGSYIGSAQDPTMGLFGLEGSRPGAAPASVYFAHTCLRPDHKGYGRIINRSLHNTRQLYAALLLLNDRPAPFRTITLTECEDSALPAEVFGVPFEEIQKSPKIMPRYRQFGPDQNIVDYGFNLEGNTDWETYNALIGKVYDALHVYCNDPTHPTPIDKYPMLITKTEFALADYGPEFMKSFAGRLGLDPKPTKGSSSLSCLRSTVMSPFVSETQKGSFWPDLQEIIFRTVMAACADAGASESAKMAREA